MTKPTPWPLLAFALVACKGGSDDSGDSHADDTASTGDTDTDTDTDTGPVPACGDGTANDAGFCFEQAAIAVPGMDAFSPSRLAIGAFEIDGHLDIAGSHSTAITLTLGTGVAGGEFGCMNPGTPQPDAHCYTNFLPFRGVLAVADVDGDGDDDLISLDSFNKQLVVMRSKGTWDQINSFETPFTFVSVPSAPRELVFHDVNGDGHGDLVVMLEGQVAVLAGTGESWAQGGGFGGPVTYTLPGYQTSMASGDFDGDGDLDLVLTGSTSEPSLLMLPGDGAGGFGAAIDLAPTRLIQLVIAADLDADGHLDLVTAPPRGISDTGGSSPVNDYVSVRLGDGAGGFGDPADFRVGVADPPSGAHEPVELIAGDYNGDGKLDLAVRCFLSSVVSLLPGDGSGDLGAPTDYPVGGHPSDMASGDVNGDGITDLVATSTYTAAYHLLLSNP